MSETAGPPSSEALSQAEVTKLWAKFRAGNVVPCPRDAHAFALAVDGAAKAYRLVCTGCGLASPWFASTPSGVVFRQPSITSGPGNE